VHEHVHEHEHVNDTSTSTFALMQPFNFPVHLPAQDAVFDPFYGVDVTVLVDVLVHVLVLVDVIGLVSISPLSTFVALTLPRRAPPRASWGAAPRL